MKMVKRRAFLAEGTTRIKTVGIPWHSQETERPGWPLSSGRKQEQFNMTTKTYIGTMSCRKFRVIRKIREATRELLLLAKPNSKGFIFVNISIVPGR